MTVFFIICSLVVIASLVVATAVQPELPPYTMAELRRRAKNSADFKRKLQQYEQHASLLTLIYSLRAVLTVLLVGTTVGGFGWFWGLLGAIVVVLCVPILARIRTVASFSTALYERYEGRLFGFVKRFDGLLATLTGPTRTPRARRVDSREDFAELLAHSSDVIPEAQRALLVSALDFFDTTVESVMTPRSMIHFIDRSEFLGPLVLSELHKLGHSRLPVISDDLEHVIGVLHLRDLLSLDIRESDTAEQVMEKKVFYIRHDDTLEHALAAFLKTRHHLFIVINELRETVGLLTLEDVIEALIGRQIVDEDDIHADLRAVAARESKTNNATTGHVDV